MSSYLDEFGLSINVCDLVTNVVLILVRRPGKRPLMTAGLNAATSREYDAATYKRGFSIARTVLSGLSLVEADARARPVKRGRGVAQVALR